MVFPSLRIALALALACVLPGSLAISQTKLFPSDTGMVDVKVVYGAAGDGVTDDTEAIRAAI